MSKAVITIAIIDDHSLLVEALEALLAQEREFLWVGSAADGEAGLKLCQDLKPDMVLLDVSLPKINGLELAGKLRQSLPGLRILLLSGHCDPYTIYRISQAGAHGFLDKATPARNFLEVIRKVAYGHVYFSAEYHAVMQEWLTRPESFQNILSKREVEVLVYVARSWNDERIAQHLGLTLNTVLVHRSRIRQKLRIHSEREMMAYAQVWGLGKVID